MANAIVRIKTAVETNDLVKANKQVDDLSKNLKKLATAGWVGAVIGVTKKIFDALDGCKKLYLETDGILSNYAKSQDILSKSTDRLKKAIGGSLVAGNNGGALLSLSQSIDRVSAALERNNRVRDAIANTQSGTNITSLDYGSLRQTLNILLEDKVLTQTLIKSMTESGQDVTAMQSYLNDLEKSIENYTKAVSGKTDAGRGGAQMAANMQSKGQTASSNITGFATSDINTFNQSIAKLEESARLFAAAEKLKNIDRSSEKSINATITEYLLATDNNFKKLVDYRNKATQGTEAYKNYQTQINAWIDAFKKSIGITVEDITDDVNDIATESPHSRGHDPNEQQNIYNKQILDRLENLNLIENLGDIGTLLNAFLSDSYMGLLIKVVNSIFTRLNEVSNNFRIVTNFIDLIVQALDPLFSVIDEILAPLSIVIEGIYGAVLTISTVIKALWTTVVNGFKWLISWLTHPIKGGADRQGYINEIANSWEMLKTIQDTVNNAFRDVSIDNTSSGGTANYTAARDINITINYNNSYVNGDSRAIALNLRDELRNIEALGL